MDSGQPGDKQFVCHGIQPIQPLLQAVQQSDFQRGAEKLQYQTGESGAGAHINEGFSLHTAAIQQRSAVQHMQGGHIVGIGDCGQVHDLVLLNEQLTVAGQLLGRLSRNGAAESQRLQSGGNQFFHRIIPQTRSPAPERQATDQ